MLRWLCDGAIILAIRHTNWEPVAAVLNALRPGEELRKTCDPAGSRAA
jgi:hypothetical protein